MKNTWMQAEDSNEVQLQSLASYSCFGIHGATGIMMPWGFLIASTRESFSHSFTFLTPLPSPEEAQTLVWNSRQWHTFLRQMVKRKVYRRRLLPSCSSFKVDSPRDIYFASKVPLNQTIKIFKFSSLLLWLAAPSHNCTNKWGDCKLWSFSS